MFGRYLLNTFLVTAALTAGQVFFGVLAAYTFARLSFPGRDIFQRHLIRSVTRGSPPLKRQGGVGRGVAPPFGGLLHGAGWPGWLAWPGQVAGPAAPALLERTLRWALTQQMSCHD